MTANSVLPPVPSFPWMTDEQAMCRVKSQDDPLAFAELVARWQTPIQRLCARMLGNLHSGQDLAQEAFVRLFACRKHYDPSGRFSTFLWKIALNLCYDELRRSNRRSECSMEEGQAEVWLAQIGRSDLPPDARLAASERAQAVRRALLRLSEPYRVVVVLRHYEGLKFREISALLEIPEGTVKSRMAAALSQLARLLQDGQSQQPSESE
jgi:RNA polymerase sigma-70 factor (ECF subfamily)